MRRWPTRPLGDVLELSRERIEPAEHPDTSFNYVGLESIEGHTGKLLSYQATLGAKIKSTKNVFHRGEILYGKLRPYLNKVYLSTTEGICSTDIYVLRPRQVHPSFAANYLRSPSVLAIVSSAMAGANLPRIGQDALLSITIPVPPLAEQKRIVNLLDEADELRKLRAQADRRTSALVPALFHEMFGDPVSNPMKWPRHKLPELCEGKEGIKAGPFGSSLKKDCYTNEGPRVYGQEQVIAGDFSIGDYHISEAKYSEMSAYVVKTGDLLISLVGTIGKVFVVPSRIERGIINPRLLRVRPQTGILHPCYLAHVLTSPSIIQFLGGIATGITMGVLNAGILKKIDVPLPPLALQKEFAQRVTEIRELETAQAASRCWLEDLFQSLIHRAFNGEL